MFLQAYKKQIYYPNYVWITFASYHNQFWRKYDDYLRQINCTQPDIVVNTVLNRALVLLPYPEVHVVHLYMCMHMEFICVFNR